MAGIIGYPSQIYNFWGQNVPRTNAVEGIVNAGMNLYKHKMNQQNQMRDLIKNLDPINYMSDFLKNQQAEKLGGLYDYIGNLSKEKRGFFSTDDLMDIQFQVKEFERWQADKEMGRRAFTQAYEEISLHPDKYKEDWWITTMLDYFETGDMPQGGFLKLKGKDPFAFFGGYQLFNPQSTISQKRVGDEIHEYQTVYYGTGDPLRDLQMRKQAVLVNYAQDDQLRQGVIDVFNALPMEKQIEYMGKAQRYNAGEKVEGMPQRQSNDPEMDKYLMWALEELPQYIQPTQTNRVESQVHQTVLSAERRAAQDQWEEQMKNQGSNRVQLRGEDAYYTTFIAPRKGKSISEEDMPKVVFEPEVVEPTPELKKMFNYEPSEEAYIIRSKRDEFNTGMAKNYGMAGQPYQVSTRGNATWYNLPYYTGDEEITIKDNTDGQKYDIDPGQPLFINPEKKQYEVHKSGVFKANIPIDEDWWSENTALRDYQKIVLDHGSVTTVILDVFNERVAREFGVLDYLREVDEPGDESIEDYVKSLDGTVR